MNYDEDKVDEFTLALLYLVAHHRREGYGARAWKGFDWDTLHRLHEKGFISNPIGKAKSIGMTEDGFLKSRAFFDKYFVKPCQSAKTQTATVERKKTKSKTPCEQPEREDRIVFEIVVDAYGSSERAMSWYYYLQDELKMPFSARCTTTRSSSPLIIGQRVDVVGMAKEDECMSEIFVLVKYGRTKLAVPLAQLDCLSCDPETCEAVADWHYWVARGYEY